MRTEYFFVRSPQAFRQSSAPGVLSTLVTSVVLCSLTRATLMSPGQDETRVCDDHELMMNCFCDMVDRQKASNLISSQGHCQRSSPSPISDMPRAEFEPAQNLSSSFRE